jgi:hypothetical protein
MAVVLSGEERPVRCHPVGPDRVPSKTTNGNPALFAARTACRSFGESVWADAWRLINLSPVSFAWICRFLRGGVLRRW